MTFWPQILSPNLLLQCLH